MLQLTSVTAEPADGKPRARTLPGRIDPSAGTFTIPGLLPGRYLIQATRVPGPGNWTFKSAVAGGIDVSDTPLTIDNRDVGGVTLTFGDTTTSLTGTVTTSQGGADPAAAVVVFPADSQLWQNYGTNPRRMRIARTTPAGAFSLNGLPAGDYDLIAISEEFAGEWQDPRFLELMSRAATHVTIADGQQAKQDLTTQAVRPSAGGLAPAPGAPDADRASADDAPDAMSPGGPFVADDATGQVPVRDPSRPPPPQRATQAPRDAAAQPATGTASISGVVLEDDGSNQPVRRARVILHGSDQVADHTTATDDTGRFAIQALPAGHYTLTVSKPAYVTVYYGSTHPGRGPGLPVTLEDGQALAGVTVRLPHGAVIAGTVTDDFGLPVPGVAVRLMQPRTVAGQSQLAPVRTSGALAQTDDRGRYRIYDLTAGSYIVSVVPPPTFGNSSNTRRFSAEEMAGALADVRQAASTPVGAAGLAGSQATPPATRASMGRTVGYALVYYPGTVSPDQAVSVTVAAGQELTNVDIPMHVVPTARVEGMVLDPNGQPAEGAQVSILPSGLGPMIIRGLSMTRSSGDGAFSVQDLAPGHYTIVARGADPNEAPPPPRLSAPSPPPPPPPPPPPAGKARSSGMTFFQQRMSLWAQEDIDVNGTDLTGVTLTLQPGMTVSGRVEFQSRSLAPPSDLSSMRVSLHVARRTPGISIGVPPAQVDSDGRFTFTGVPPGQYELAADVPGGAPGGSSAWWLKSAVVDQRDTLDSSLDVQPGQNVQGLVLTFSDQQTELSGTLVDKTGKPAAGLSILVFSTDRRFWTPGSRRLADPVRTASDGTYKTSGLPAGEYYLAAVPDLEPDQADDPAFLEQVVPAAIRITLADGEKKVQDIRIGG
jgi:Carboxypeptidase regulatory-like domain